jgi:hypothetical protein
LINRSPNGWCLVGDQPVAVGTVLSVQPAQSQANLRWFPVEVHDCRPEQGMWIVDCQFVQLLSPADLSLFTPTSECPSP